MLVLLGRGLTLDGSVEGIMYFITPQWHRLASAKVRLVTADDVAQQQCFLAIFIAQVHSENDHHFA